MRATDVGLRLRVIRKAGEAGLLRKSATAAEHVRGEPRRSVARTRSARAGDAAGAGGEWWSARLKARGVRAPRPHFSDTPARIAWTGRRVWRTDVLIGA